MLNKKLSLITLFSTITLMSIFSIGRTSASPLNADGVLTYDTVSVNISIEDLQPSVTTSNTDQIIYSNSEDAIVSEQLDDETRWFDFILTTKVPTVSSDFFNLYTGNAGGRNVQAVEAFKTYGNENPGSATNKFRLTQILMDYALFSTSVGSTTTLSLRNLGDSTQIEIDSFVSITSSTAEVDLNSSLGQVVYNFPFSSNIQRFSLIPSAPMLVKNILLTYSIDYSNC